MRQQSGQLLYFLSGFLSIQLEIQNFLSLVGLGGPLIETKVRDLALIPWRNIITLFYAMYLQRISLHVSSQEYNKYIAKKNLDTVKSTEIIFFPVVWRIFTISSV